MRLLASTLALFGLAALLFADAARAQAPPTPFYANGLELDDCVTGNNQFWNSPTGTYHWYVNQALGSDGADGTIKCDSHTNDQYERPTNQSYKNFIITEKPTGALSMPPFSYPMATAAGKSPQSPPYLSGLGPDTEFSTGSTVFSSEGTYFEYIDITRGRTGFADVDANNGWMFFEIELFGDSEVAADLKRTAEASRRHLLHRQARQPAGPEPASVGNRSA